MSRNCDCSNGWQSHPPPPYSFGSPRASPAPSPCACDSPASPPSDRHYPPSTSPTLLPYSSPSPSPAPASTIAASASASAPAPSPLNSAPPPWPPFNSAPFNSAPSPRPPFNSAPPPPWATGAATRAATAPWWPPRRMATSPRGSPGYSPAPVPAAMGLHTKAAHHHYGAIAGVAAAAFLLCVGTVLLLTFFLKKKRPQCIRASGHGPKMAAAAGRLGSRSEPSAKSLEPSTSGGAAAAPQPPENAKRDAAGNEQYEEYVVTSDTLGRSNGHGSPGHGRRRSPAAASGESVFNQSLEAQKAPEKQETAAAASGGDRLRNDEPGRSGRGLGERYRDAKSVRTRNFATSRID